MRLVRVRVGDATRAARRVGTGAGSWICWPARKKSRSSVKLGRRFPLGVVRKTGSTAGFGFWTK